MCVRNELILRTTVAHEVNSYTLAQRLKKLPVTLLQMTVTIAGFDQSLLCAADVTGASRPVRVRLRAAGVARRWLGLGEAGVICLL